jgi:hypothetical protein
MSPYPLKGDFKSLQIMNNFKMIITFKKSSLKGGLRRAYV